MRWRKRLETDGRKGREEKMREEEQGVVWETKTKKGDE